MDSCAICGCSSWFFEVSEEGLCGSCERLAKMEIEQLSKAVTDASRLAESTVNPQSKISHMDAVLSGLKNLAEFEKKGVAVPEGSPGEMLRKVSKERDSLILGTAREDLKLLLKSVGEARAAKEKEKLYNSFLIKLQEFKAQVGDRAALDQMTVRVRNSLVAIRLNDFLESGRRCEKAGDKIAAVRRYQEGLSYLEQKGGRQKSITRMKDKLAERIRSLGGPGTS